MPEYTISLLFWIVPVVLIAVFIEKKHLLTSRKKKAFFITVAVLALAGCILDLLFARLFFTFPNRSMILGWYITGIPVEEFVFYITGFWFILFLYVFSDEWFLKKYNPDDTVYARFASRLRRLIFPHGSSVITYLILLVTGIGIKFVFNRDGAFLPGYYVFLLTVAYIPMILFYRVTKKFVNWRAFSFTLLVTVLLSIIWEVTLALPRGYWGYNKDHMLGIFAPAWSNLPIEAVSVWMFSTLVILVYEFLKISYFTKSRAERRVR